MKKLIFRKYYISCLITYTMCKMMHHIYNSILGVNYELCCAPDKYVKA